MKVMKNFLVATLRKQTQVKLILFTTPNISKPSVYFIPRAYLISCDQCYQWDSTDLSTLPEAGGCLPPQSLQQCWMAFLSSCLSLPTQGLVLFWALESSHLSSLWI